MRTLDDILKDGAALFVFLSDAGTAAGPAGVLLAMGSQDLRVADTAARAFQEVGADYLVCSGGFGKDTTGLLKEPESVLYARRCRELGVPADRILIEDKSTNSGENFCFSRALLAERKIYPRTGVVACKPYMAKRAWATGTKQWPEVRWSVFRQELSLTEYLSQGNDLTAVLNLMVGDLQRLRAYAGIFQAPVPVPEPVWQMYERLAADGYNRYVIGAS
ncbi:MAG: YdcF family protein [Oscillibacter sp.]|nr:YdcF family protein [Oscillibacter sp.]